MVNQRVIKRTNMIVQSGLFKGLRLGEQARRGDGDVALKFLGVY